MQRIACLIFMLDAVPVKCLRTALLIILLTREGHHSCSSSCFPCVGVRLVYWSLRSTATFVICFHRSLLLAFSLHFYSSSAFLRSLFTQSSHLSCGLHRFLEPSCFFVSALFGSLSSFIRTMCPAHFIRLLTCIIYTSFIKRLKC